MKQAEIKKMSINERIQVMESLWDSLLHDQNNLTSPPWHQDILEERQKK